MSNIKECGNDEKTSITWIGKSFNKNVEIDKASSFSCLAFPGWWEWRGTSAVDSGWLLRLLGKTTPTTLTNSLLKILALFTITSLKYLYGWFYIITLNCIYFSSSGQCWVQMFELTLTLMLNKRQIRGWVMVTTIVTLPNKLHIMCY